MNCQTNIQLKLYSVADVFAMPQSGTGVSVEAVDPVFQAKMLDMLKQTGRPEMVVGWYHSHPGFGCWLSGVDINTQQSFEALTERAVAVVIGKFYYLSFYQTPKSEFSTVYRTNWLLLSSEISKISEL